MAKTVHKKYDSRAIANRVLKHAWSMNISLTKMQLIKMVYMVQGWSLALAERSLVADTPQAWKLGPVYPKLYKALSGYTSQPVNRLLTEKSTDIVYPASDLKDNEDDFIRSIARSYGKHNAFALSDMTHKNGTPWSKIYQDGEGLYDDIPEEVIENYYKRLKLERNIQDKYFG